MIYNMRGRVLCEDTVQDLIVRQLATIDALLEPMSDEDRADAEIALAASLCERSAYRNARRWPSERIGQLIGVAAKLQRLMPGVRRCFD
ncbi:hypothetical protein PARU111607_05090 [Palleronia rufa]